MGTSTRKVPICSLLPLGGVGASDKIDIVLQHLLNLKRAINNVTESICIFCIGKECILFVLKWDRKILLGTRIT